MTDPIKVSALDEVLAHDIDDDDVLLVSHEDVGTLKSVKTKAEIFRTREDMIAALDVGAVDAGDTIPKGTDVEALVHLLLGATFHPTFTAPTASLSSNLSAFEEIGRTVDVTLTMPFSRGSINGDMVGGVWDPSAKQDDRAGPASEYVIDGVSTGLTNNRTVSGYAIALGANTWSATVSHEAGPQPVDSQGDPYSTPLDPGDLTRNHTRTGVYPYFSTTVDITTLTKQTLVSMTSAYVQVSVVAETEGDKQTVDLPVAWAAITGIQFYNTVSSAWEWINGSKANSLLTFDVTPTTHTVQGNAVDYDRFTHNGPLTGARQLRFYTT